MLMTTVSFSFRTKLCKLQPKKSENIFSWPKSKFYEFKRMAPTFESTWLLHLDCNQNPWLPWQTGIIQTFTRTIQKFTRTIQKFTRTIQNFMRPIQKFTRTIQRATEHKVEEVWFFDFYWDDQGSYYGMDIGHLLYKMYNLWLRKKARSNSPSLQRKKLGAQYFDFTLHKKNKNKNHFLRLLFQIYSVMLPSTRWESQQLSTLTQL